MIKGWRLSLTGILIVGTTSIVAPMLKLSHYDQTIPLFILFVLFVLALNGLDWIRNRFTRKYK